MAMNKRREEDDCNEPVTIWRSPKALDLYRFDALMNRCREDYDEVETLTYGYLGF